MNYNTKYVVRLTEEEREQLSKLVKTGKVAAKRCRAQVLLKADGGPEGSGLTDQEVSRALGGSVGLVHSARQAYVEQGLTAALERKPACRHRPRKLDGAQEAQLVALTCSPAPAGHARWTLRLLASKLVELQVVDSISKDAVRNVLKKNKRQPWLKHHWVLPKADDPDFVCAMEDVLEVYTRPDDPERPQVCVDEVSKQLVTDITPPVPMQPGQPAREDYEYERCGTARPVPDLRAAGRAAAREGDRPPDQRRLCPGAAGSIGRALPRGEEDRAGDGQSEHAQALGALPGVSRGRSATHPGAVRGALHPQARQLAEYGRV